MPLAVALIFLVVGSLVFHFLSPWTFTELASNWGMIDQTVDITLVVTGIVFVAVNLFMAYAIIRYKYRPDAKANYEPENKKLEVWLTVVTAIGVAAMLAPGLFVFAKFVNVPDGATQIEAVGQQWRWSYRLPGDDGEFGTVDTMLISEDNLFGIDPEDPNGQDDVLIDSPIVNIPLGEPIRFWLRSKDVLHNFTVTQFRVKMDLVPGLTSFLWLEPTKLGEFEVLCEELCGVAHHAMRGWVNVVTPEDYAAWVDTMPTFAETQARNPNAGLGAASYAVCSACHGQQGEGLQALNAPKLTGLDWHYFKRQIRNYQEGLRGTHPDDTYGLQMRPMAATLATEEMIENVFAHIQTLPDNPAPQTVTGDVENGERLYEVCANCHGKDGMGVAMNAPRQSGMSDWYLLNQLRNFKGGLRGHDAKDIQGRQMGFFSRTLFSEDDMRDVVAYINTL